MTIPPPDPRRFLLESIPDRFGKLTPESFASFIQYLFQLDGYEVQDVINSTTLGQHIRAIKDDIQLVILPIHVPMGTLVEKDVIQKAIQAKELYHLQQAWVITNSSYKPDAQLLADQKDIEVWDWDELYAAICQLFFEGKSHLEYVAPVTLPVNFSEEISFLKLKVKWEAQEGVGTAWFNLNLRITNPSTSNIFIHLELPVLLDSHKTQIAAEEWVSGEFVSGTLYAGATIKTNALFNVSKLGDRPAGGKVILTYHERNEALTTHHLSAKLKGEACYVVTYCYGRQSMEYKSMIQYRDEQLSKTWLGKCCIRLYYILSPSLVNLAHHSKFFGHCLNLVVRKLVKNSIGPFTLTKK